MFTIGEKFRSIGALRISVRVIFLLTVLYIMATYLTVAATSPLWLDESWSAMIATQSTWSQFWNEAWFDVNPPFYYVVLSVWVSIFGDSNLVLRLPSIICVLCAAACPIVWRPSGMNAAAAWTFAAMIMFWPFGAMVMLDARGYALLLLLSSASCIIFTRMLQNLTRQTAALWVVIGTIMFLTHYYSATLLLAEFAVLMIRHKWALFRVWPAGLWAIPGLAWFVYHMPRLQEYARPDVVWQQTTTPHDILPLLSYVTGSWNIPAAIVLALILFLALRERAIPAAIPGVVADDARIATRAILCVAVLGFGTAVVIGTFQASLVHRYLIPLVPVTLMAFVLILQHSVRQEAYGALAALLFVMPALNPNHAKAATVDRALYGFETSSKFVQAYQPDALIFLWDHPAAKILDNGSLKKLGGYFLARDSVNIPVTAIVVRDTDDANQILRMAAGTRRTAIIWIYNKSDKTSARNFAPTFENDPAWRCRDRKTEAKSENTIGAIACIKRDTET